MTLLKEDESGSVAVGNTYIQDLYENYSRNDDSQSTQPHETIENFLSNLETGSIICDVGCGDAKYLNSPGRKHYFIGVDQCIRISKIAKNTGNEILICDNLALPFRDGSFDVVLSISVIHHFATTERRICALRELSRILRIGGKLLITAWALEPNERDRTIGSPDAIYSWSQRPNSFERKRTTFQKRLSASTTTTTTKDNNRFPLYFFNFNLFHYLSITRLKKGNETNSNVSSPSETCYGFVKKALQKLAGRRSKISKQWSLRSWGSSFSQNSFIYKLTQSESNIDKDSLDILDNISNRTANYRRPSSTFDKQSLDGVKCGRSKSMVNLTVCDCDKNSTWTKNSNDISETKKCVIRLVKYKSMDDELIDPVRLLEKKKLHKNLPKQTSFNEDMIKVAQKKIRLIRNELTNKIRQQNLINMDKMNTTTIRSSFEKLLQNWKNYQNTTIEKPKIVLNEIADPVKDKNRRFSNGEDTDSSKDGSMFSESSMDSEESFISVIFNPNARKRSTPTTTATASPNNLSPNVAKNPFLSPTNSNLTESARDHDDFKSTNNSSEQDDNFVIFQPNSTKIKTVPKFYSLDLYNPVLDDNESSSPSSESSDTSSNSSVKSVISVGSSKEKINNIGVNESENETDNKLKSITTEFGEENRSDESKNLQTISEQIEKHRKYLITLNELDEKSHQSVQIDFYQNDNNNNNNNNETKKVKSKQNLKSLLPVGSSTESNDTGYISEKTLSISDSLKDSNSRCSCHSSSAASLLTCSSLRDCEKGDSNLRQRFDKEIRNAECQRFKLLHSLPSNSSTNNSCCGMSRCSISDRLAYQKYYHLFSEGELDQLIEQFVDNLHIINSYYDQANWCIVAEKVQVWTI